MAIEFDCTGCGKRLRVQDQDAGKKAECPECHTIGEIPAAPTGSRQPVEPAVEVPRPAHGRIDPSDPYPTAEETIDRTLDALGIQPTRIELDDVLLKTWELFKQNLGMVLGTVWLVVVANTIMSELVGQLIESGNPMAPPVQLASLALATFLHIGLTIVLLRIARSQGAAATHLIAGGHYFWRVAGASICFLAIVVLGLAALIIPGIILGLMFGQYGYLIVEKDVGVADSLRISRAITSGNKLTLAALSCVVGVLFFLVGGVTCGLGLIVVIPYVVLVPIVAYLRMTGQIAPAGEELVATP